MRIVIPFLLAGSALVTERVAEASCAGPTDYSMPVAGSADVAPDCGIELLVVGDYAEFDVSLLVVRLVGGEEPSVLAHTLESQLADDVIHVAHWSCDLATCEEVEEEGFEFPVDRHTLIVDGGLPASSAIEVATAEGRVLAAFTTAAGPDGSCPTPDTFDIDPVDCYEPCDVHAECDDVQDGPPEDGGCAVAGGEAAPGLFILLLGLLLHRRVIPGTDLEN